MSTTAKKQPVIEYDPHTDVINTDGTITKMVCADCGGFCRHKAGGLNGYYCIDGCNGSKARNHWARVTPKRYTIPLVKGARSAK